MSNHLTCVDHKRRSLVLRNSQIHRDGTKCKSHKFILGSATFTADSIRTFAARKEASSNDNPAANLLTDIFTGG